MTTIKDVARKMLKRGYNIIPTTKTKQPGVWNWTQYQTKAMSLAEFEEVFKAEHNIGLLTGGEKRIICLDADMKYDLTGDLFERFMAEIPKELKDKVYIQSTQNSGFHLIFMAPADRLNGNEILARRYTTANEKHQTYMEEFHDPETRDNALKTAINDKYRVLFETRSGYVDKCGGYFLIAPSEGYTYLKGKIQEISGEECDLILEAARSFNEIREKSIGVVNDYSNWNKSPFEHFNEEGDVLEVFSNNGWKIDSANAKKIDSNNMPKFIRLKRPGKTHSHSSGMVDMRTKVFNCFSTSTSFEINKGYTPTGVFIILECDGDESLAYNKLIELGYGIK